MMDTIYEIFADLFVEFFSIKKLNHFFQNKISNRPLRYIVIALIYLLTFSVSFGIITVVCFLIFNSK